jgi:hypothetical protein
MWAERLAHDRPWPTWTHRMTFACGAVAVAGLVQLEALVALLTEA